MFGFKLKRLVLCVRLCSNDIFHFLGNLCRYDSSSSCDYDGGYVVWGDELSRWLSLQRTCAHKAVVCIPDWICVAIFQGPLLRT